MQCDRKMFLETGTGPDVVVPCKLLNRTVNGSAWQKASSDEIPIWQSTRGSWRGIRNSAVVNKVTKNGIGKIEAKL